MLKIQNMISEGVEIKRFHIALFVALIMVALAILCAIYGETVLFFVAMFKATLWGVLSFVLNRLDKTS